MIKQRSSLPHSVSHFICCGCVGSMRENIFMYNLLIIEKDHVPLPLDLQKEFTLFQLMKSKINLTKACKHKHTYEQMIVTALYARSKMWGSYVHVPFSIAWVEGNTWLSCYGFLGSSFSFMHIYIKIAIAAKTRLVSCLTFHDQT